MNRLTLRASFQRPYEGDKGKGLTHPEGLTDTVALECQRGIEIRHNDGGHRPPESRIGTRLREVRSRGGCPSPMGV